MKVAVLSGSGDNDDVSSSDGLTEGAVGADGIDDGSGTADSSPPPHDARSRDAAKAALKTWAMCIVSQWKQIDT